MQLIGRLRANYAPTDFVQHSGDSGTQPSGGLVLYQRKTSPTELTDHAVPV